MFFPRGGSAQVARALAEELPAHGWDVTILSGSLGRGGVGDADRFYAGLDVHAVDFTPGDAPMHPPSEDRPGAPDRSSPPSATPSTSATSRPGPTRSSASAPRRSTCSISTT